MGTDSPVLTSSPPLVALASWLLPGGGYVLIGHRARGITIGVTIISLFMAGLLIAGVRVIEVPGYKADTGERQLVTVTRAVLDRHGNQVLAAVQTPIIDPMTGKPMVDEFTGQVKMEPLKQWSLLNAPLSEIRDKPWSVPQAMTGPIAIIAGAISISSAVQDTKTEQRDSRGDPIPNTGTYAALTHARVNELGSLYLSVAGLLNLMAIIDATWRATQLRETLAETIA